MKNLTKEELDVISDRLCNLAFECQFMYDSARLSSFLIGTYVDSPYLVVCRLQDVLRRADKFLDDLHSVEASLDSLLIEERILQDSEV